MFKKAACYPYCMAARKTNSGSDGLILYNANDWKSRVQLMDRDCGVKTHLTNPAAAASDGVATYLFNGTSSEFEDLFNIQQEGVEVVTGNNILHGSVLIKKWDPALGSVQSSQARTIMALGVHDAYKNNAFRSILMPGQPFAYASDVTLTAVRSNIGEYFVAVDRLYGNEQNEYTMINVLKNFPASQPADTIKLGGQVQSIVHALPIPYAFSDMAGVTHPAVSTQTAVFFAVNPSLAMFKGFSRVCLTQGYEWRTQLSALSSYAPIWVWKVDPFTYCKRGDVNMNNGQTVDDCGIGRVHFVDIPDAFTQIGDDGFNVFDIRKCNMTFAVSVEGLEFINDENIAVTVLRASFSGV